MFKNGCCNYYDHQVYLGNIFPCTKDNYYYKHLCIYERNKSKYKLYDFSFLENYENFQYIEGKIIYGCRSYFFLIYDCYNR